MILSISIIALIAALAARFIWQRCILCPVVQEHEAALLFKHGKFLRQLATGRHVLFGTGFEVKTLETRRQDFLIPGQEFLTADKIGLRVSAIVEFHIVDPLLFHQSCANPIGSLYHAVQIALRHGIGGQSLESVIERKADLSAALIEEVKPSAAKIGIALDQVAAKDLMISGDLRKVFSESLSARQQSNVTLERARAEAAAIRTLANAARAFETHPALLQLKFLQALEKADGGIAQPLALGAAGQWLDFLKK